MLRKQTLKIEGFFWIAIGIIICFLAWRAHIGSFREPGSGFIAFATGLFLSGIGLVMVFSKAFSTISRGTGDDSGHSFRMVSWSRLFYTMALLLIYALLLDKLGYVLTTFFVMWGLFHDWKKNRWITSFFAAILATGATYLVFEVWLQCQFPRGVFPWW